MSAHPDGRGYTASSFDRDMTLRDWFAAQALPVALTEIFVSNDGPSYSELAGAAAECAYVIADAMLKAREDKP
jgi:hypothetical protein